MGGKSPSGQFSAAALKPTQMGERIFRQGAPARKELFGQLAEALRTGGVGAQIPFIQRGVEATNAATSQAMRNAEARLGRGAQTPFGQRLLAQLGQQGALQASLLPTQGAQQLIGQAGNIIPGLGGQATQLLGAGSQAGAQLGGQQMASQAAILGSIFDALGSIGGGFGESGGFQKLGNLFKGIF